MKNGTLSCALKASKIWKGPWDSRTVRPIKCQQARTKSQCKKRWSCIKHSWRIANACSFFSGCFVYWACHEPITRTPYVCADRRFSYPTEDRMDPGWTRELFISFCAWEFLASPDVRPSII
jgi:hypothetical protein